MKRKIYLAVMAAAVISMAGCGKKTADTSTDATPEPTQEATVTEEATQKNLYRIHRKQRQQAEMKRVYIRMQQV